MALALVLSTHCSGPSSERPLPREAHPAGVWSDTRFTQRAPHLSDEDRRAFQNLGALGYTEALEFGRADSGVLEHDRERADPGLNLYCSGHAAEAFLMDMEGRRVHHWSCPYDELPGAPEADQSFQRVWRRVRLLPGGSLLAIHEGLGLVKLDRDSRIEWCRFDGEHHDLCVGGDGRIWVLTRVEARIEPLGRGRTVVEDAILELEPDGTLLRRVSIPRALLRSAWRSEAILAARHGGDFLHTNSIQRIGRVAPEALGVFAPGRVLISMRDIDALAVVDLDEEEVVWLRRGPWAAQHDPSLLADGNLLVFDNMGNEGFSRVLEYDPRDERVAWQHAGSSPDEFFSIFCGAAQRLANGNTLVTESYRGQAFELTPSDEVVWSFASPHRAGAGERLVAVTFEVQRLPLEAGPPTWAGGPSDEVLRPDARAAAATPPGEPTPPGTDARPAPRADPRATSRR